MIDFRVHDVYERARQPADGSLEFSVDTEAAQCIRDGLRAMREAEAFAAADKRMLAGRRANKQKAQPCARGAV